MTALRRLPLAVAVVVSLALAACGDDDGSAADGDEGAGGGGRTELVGLFRVAAGECAEDGPSGSWFRMVQPGGTLEEGPFVVNGDSQCDDKTWTLLAPGTDGGLLAGSHQPQPEPPFDEAGNATSGRITAPQPWFAVAFAVATNEVDPQTGVTVAAPSIVHADGVLDGDLRAVAAAWNGQHFNQGAPKPGGDRPGATAGPTGTYDPGTRAYTLDWSSQIAGGPFDGFTGVWHLEGTFEPS